MHSVSVSANNKNNKNNNCNNGSNTSSRRLQSFLLHVREGKEALPERNTFVIGQWQTALIGMSARSFRVFFTLLELVQSNKLDLPLTMRRLEKAWDMVIERKSPNSEALEALTFFENIVEEALTILSSELDSSSSAVLGVDEEAHSISLAFLERIMTAESLIAPKQDIVLEIEESSAKETKESKRTTEASELENNKRKRFPRLRAFFKKIRL